MRLHLSTPDKILINTHTHTKHAYTYTQKEREGERKKREREGGRERSLYLCGMYQSLSEDEHHGLDCSQPHLYLRMEE